MGPIYRRNKGWVSAHYKSTENNYKTKNRLHLLLILFYFYLPTFGWITSSSSRYNHPNQSWKFCNRKVLLSLYQALVPAADYGAPVCGLGLPSQLTLFDIIQNAFIRACTGALWTSWALSLCSEATPSPRSAPHTIRRSSFSNFQTRQFTTISCMQQAHSAQPQHPLTGLPKSITRTRHQIQLPNTDLPDLSSIGFHFPTKILKKSTQNSIILSLFLEPLKHFPQAVICYTDDLSDQGPFGCRGYSIGEKLYGFRLCISAKIPPF